MLQLSLCRTRRLREGTRVPSLCSQHSSFGLPEPSCCGARQLWGKVRQLPAALAQHPTESCSAVGSRAGCACRRDAWKRQKAELRQAPSARPSRSSTAPAAPSTSSPDRRCVLVPRGAAGSQSPLSRAQMSNNSSFYWLHQAVKNCSAGSGLKT